MDLRIDGDAAVVTASSSGLGKASAKALAREGANVVINGRDEERLDAAVDELREVATGEVVAQQGDITERDDIEALIERSVSEFGGLDHLVTSAGGPPSGLLMDTTDEDWYTAFDLLVMSVVRAARAAAPHLRDGGGTIVNITSMTVKEASDSIVLSNAVRMGVIGLEKTLSREFAPEVRANAVLPGSHNTARIRELDRDAVERGEYESVEAARADRAEEVPVDKIGDPMDLGEVVAFLSSPRSDFVNGVAVPIDGGAHRSNL